MGRLEAVLDAVLLVCRELGENLIANGGPGGAERLGIRMRRQDVLTDDVLVGAALDVCADLLAIGLDCRRGGLESGLCGRDDGLDCGLLIGRKIEAGKALAKLHDAVTAPGAVGAIDTRAFVRKRGQGHGREGDGGET